MADPNDIQPNDDGTLVTPQQPQAPADTDLGVLGNIGAVTGLLGALGGAPELAAGGGLLLQLRQNQIKQGQQAQQNQALFNLRTQELENKQITEKRLTAKALTEKEKREQEQEGLKALQGRISGLPKELQPRAKAAMAGAKLGNANSITDLREIFAQSEQQPGSIEQAKVAADAGDLDVSDTKNVETFMFSQLTSAPGFKNTKANIAGAKTIARFRAKQFEANFLVTEGGFLGLGATQKLKEAEAKPKADAAPDKDAAPNSVFVQNPANPSDVREIPASQLDQALKQGLQQVTPE